MIGRGKSKQDRAKGLSQRLKEDRTSLLPDSLICHILSHLPIDDAVRTSILSTRWRSLWLWIPCVELNPTNFPDLSTFLSFGDRFFHSNKVSYIHKLKLTNYYGHEVDTSYITSWIEAAVMRKIQHLHVQCPPMSHCEMPLSLYVCETLVSLKLFYVPLNDAEFVSFPCLNTMHLKFVRFSNDTTFERLVSCCPVLEDIKMVGCMDAPPLFRVHSRSLRRLSIVNIARRRSSNQVDSVRGVVIDAPLLCCLRIIDHDSKSFILNNLEFNAKLDISLNFGLKGFDEASVSSGRSHICSFLAGISNVGDLAICARTFMVIHQYSKSESLPQFGYMSRLCVALHAYYFKWLAPFLESCPNLKSLVLVPDNCYYHELLSEEMNQISFSFVPKCLLSSLEFVDFKFPFSGLVAELKLVRYFLENSAILKKLTIHLNSHSTKDEILKKLFILPRAITKCEVVTDTE